MASPITNLAARTMARIRRAMGITSSVQISDSRAGQEETIHFGMFTTSELRHMDGVLQNYSEKQHERLTEDVITSTLTEVSANTRKTIDEIKNLKLMAPEITQAQSIIVSSIISPMELQTDSINVLVNHPGLDDKLNTAISTKLTKFFNDEYKLGPKLAEWLGCAGFEEGAKAILILPKHQLDLLNTVGDNWDKETLNKFNEFKKRREEEATEGLIGKRGVTAIESYLNAKEPVELDNFEFGEVEAAMEATAISLLSENKIGSEYISNEAKEQDKKEMMKNATAAEKEAAKLITAPELAKTLAHGAFRLLHTAEHGDAVLVTKDLTLLKKRKTDLEDKLNELTQEAATIMTGFDPKHPDVAPTTPVMTVSDIIKTGDNDMPIVVELPSDSVVPVCAPGDNKNHIGYYVLIDENGQPLKGQYSFTGAITSDATNRLATNAARTVYGNSAIKTYMAAGMKGTDVLDQMSQVFSVAVNHLLESKLNKEGLTGLDVHIHEAVGKCLFFNLLAKTKVKMVFVPATMMVYYRFLHRENGTGKTFLEDIAYILAMRCTLVVAKLMAAMENATKHRRIEVNVDEKNQNVLGTVNLVRHAVVSKKVPQFSSDPTTTAENLINQHLSIVPRGLVGNTDDLNITTETQYGQAQAPDDALQEQLNNWVGMGLKVPPSALNQLNETEYSRSVATSNLFFSNAVRGWQNMIKPENKKFLLNYILASDQLLKEIRKMIADDFTGKTTKTKKGVEKAQKDDETETKSQDPKNDEKVEAALRRVLNTVELNLPAPNMSTSKAHFEEINSQIDAVDKILQTIYPDDIAPSDELRSLVASVRAVAASKALREFLPKLGFHTIAEIPFIDQISTTETAKIIQFLANFKRRVDNRIKLTSGQLADQNGGGDTGSDYGSEGTDTGTEEGGGEEEGAEEQGGDDLDFKI